MKLVSVLALVALVVSCHIDKLLKGGGTPPSNAPPARVAFSSPPSSARAGEPINPPVQVTVRDSAGHVTLRDTLVILSLGANPSGDSLRGDTLAHSVNGVATFVNVRLDKAADGYRLTAAAPELHPDTSPAFSVMPAPASVLAFTVQPTDATVQVTAYDALGNTATDFTGPIRLAFGTDASVSGNAALAGRNPVPAVAGVATFTDLAVDQPGSGYTLTAAFGNATPVATSAAFKIIPAPPPTGDLTVSTSTTGSNLPTSYTVTVDGGSSRTIPADGGSTTYSGLSATTHTVALTNVPANCTASGGPSQTVTVPANGTATAPFTITCQALTGSLTVTTATTGSNPPTSYTVTVDGGSSRTIPANGGTTTYSGLSATTHTVALTNVPANCTASGGNSQTVTVPANGTATAPFTITCQALTGSLDVSTNTSGGTPDPDGYTVTVSGGGGGSQHINTDGSVTFSNLTVGSHTVTLTGLAPNCTVSGGASQPVTISAGTTSPISFSVSCPTPPPPNRPPVVDAGPDDPNVLVGLLYTLSVSFSDPDNNGPWSYRIDWGDGTSNSTGNLPSQGSFSVGHTYLVPLTSHTIRVTVTDADGLSGSDTKEVGIIL